MKRNTLISAVTAVAVAGLAVVSVEAQEMPGASSQLSSAIDEAEWNQQPLFYFGGFAIYPWFLARVIGGLALAATIIGAIVAPVQGNRE